MVRIQVKHVTKKYKNTLVLDKMEYGFEDKMYLITGPNGSGKSTLLKCIVSCLQYDGNIIKHTQKEIAYLPEKVQVPFYVSVSGYLETLLEDEVGKKEIEDMLKTWSLENAKDKLLMQLSKGMLQKVLLSYIFLQRSDIYLLDEPLSGLDSKSQMTFVKEFKKIKNKNACILLTTHYPSLVEELFDVRLEYKNGMFL